MLLYTDGVYEAKNPKGEEFSVDRLQQLVGACPEQSAAELVTNISEAVDTFTDNCPKDDDLTLIAIEVSGEN
jgi:sigma-B regulation protein RsbU (phosphoserine phosphatase)